MSLIDKLSILFGGISALLGIASVIGFVLSCKVTSENGRTTVANLNARIKAWWVMVAIFAVSFGLGRGVTVVLFALTSFYTLREFISLTPTRGADHLPLVAAFYVLLPLQYWLIWTDWYALFAILVPVYGFLLLPSLAALKGDAGEFLLRVSRIQWALMLTVYCISHAPALLTLDIPGRPNEGFLLLFFLITVAQFSDVMQYVFGKLFGRTKVAPVVSPSKTVEGLVGGGLSAVAAGAGLWWITPFTPLQAAAMALAIVAMGFLGGLSLSAVKRSMGVKDWGTMISGHGGVLDRMDSLSFAAPVFFHLTRYFYT
ncbi:MULTISPECIES: phosphatidate cytidylyltransferase [Sinorhizobium]|uniref:Phosphatidate cytidylyltransferase n=1 Tax=Sinorhizobium americanum TaxID=194963 RepID=A0A2S3YL91_9HYPH|nr:MULTISPECIES: phosphatidate cytidylyltransferase [Sinorhizobium]PDT41944.1 phosphatidate cytidylyltransferase [Sinorhizobium sp. FG01]POH28754.1 phosphatidate cytidylyltransferase [Sinorhizobium americanum]